MIKAVINKVGLSKVLAVRPRINKEYEITLTDERSLRGVDEWTDDQGCDD